MARKLRIVVLGMMGRCPYGGQTWLYLNWLRGLACSGHDVWYIEDDVVWPYDPVRETTTDDCLYAIQHLSSCLGRIGLQDRWAFRLSSRAGACWGTSPERLNDLYRSCDVLLNIVGATDLREEQLAAPFRVYLETDPVSAELRLAHGDEHTRIAFDNHHVLVTYGENYGSPDCGVPLNGRSYLKTRQPIDLDLWPMCFRADAGPFTTIGNYRQSGGDVEYQGHVFHWSKHYEWEKFIDLPRQTGQRFLVALRTEAEDRARLEAHGWQVISPLDMTLDTFGSYPAFIRSSRAEWTVAKEQNLRLRSGWFSERDACYLASGKPVVVQDTGFGNILPTGKGLFGFSKMEEVLDAIDRINSDYREHCEAARAVALEFFDAPKVASKLLKDIGLT